MASYYSSHFPPKCHLAGMPAWHEMPAQSHTLSQTEPVDLKPQINDTQKFYMCPPKNQEYFPTQEPAKIPPWHPPSGSSLCMTAARQHCKYRQQTLLCLCVFQEPCSEEHLAFIFQAVRVQPTQILCQCKALQTPHSSSLPTSPWCSLNAETCNPTTAPWLPSKHGVLALPCQLSMLNAKKNPESLY